MQPLDLPDFDFADEPTLERFLPSFDGRWSQQTKAIQKSLGTQQLELNGSWAGTPTDWFCPVCRRYKPEIARLTPAGVILCQLDRHHDHLGDEGARILWRGQQKQPDRARQDALHSAIQVCMALGERFHQTLVCSDCNAADGAAKSALAGIVHPEFSFAPSEIARFIRVAPNRPHDVDIEAARAVWLEVADDVHDRLSFMEVMARRVAEGRHSREGSGYTPHHKATLLTDVLSAAGHPRMQVEWLAGAVEKRSIQRDGFASSVKKTSKKAVSVPTRDDLARFTASQHARDFWHAPAEDWRCAACDRSRFEMLRKSPKSGLWTAGAHRRRVFLGEADPDALWRRNGWYEHGLTFGDHDTVWVCKDCRLIITDAKQTGQNLTDDCLSVADLRELLISVSPHERPEYDRKSAARRARDNFEVMAAIEDYDLHRRRCLDLFYDRRRLLRSNREADVILWQLEAVWEDHIEESQRAGHLAWLVDQGRRFAEVNLRDRWPRDDADEG